MGVPRKVPNDNILKKERKNGLTGADIAKKYGVSKVCVCRHLKRLGINNESPIGKRGEEHSQWKGGRGLKSGYWTVYNPSHPRALNNGRVWEHVLIMEKHLKRPITKKEHVHHIDFNRQNNDINNLYVCSHEEHAQIHGSLESILSSLLQEGIVKFINGRYE